MKLTKGMKKALSLLLASAMVVTGANVTSTASAKSLKGDEETEAPAEEVVTGNMEKFTVDMSYVSTDWSESAWNANPVEITKDGVYEVSYTAEKDSADIHMIILSTNLMNGSVAKDFKLIATDLIVSNEEEKTEVKLDTHEGYFQPADGNMVDNGFRYNVRNPYNYLVNNDDMLGNVTDADGEKIITDAIGKEVPVKAGDKITVKFVVSGMDKDAETVTFDPNAEATDKVQGDPIDADALVKAICGMAGFTVDMSYVSADWSESAWNANPVKVTGDGDYEVSYTVGQDSADILMIILTTNLKNGSLAKDFKLIATDVVVGDEDVKLDTHEGYFQPADGNMVDNGFRYNVRNPYNYLVNNDDMLGFVTDADGEKIITDAIGKEVPVKAGDKITVKFSVIGMDADAETITYDPKAEAVDKVQGDAYDVEALKEAAAKKDQPTETATTAPVATKAAIATPAPVATKAAIATPATIATPDAVVKVAKKVVVASGKTKKVAVTTSGSAASVQVAALSKAAKKLISSAKVVDGKVVVKAKKVKKASFGKSAAIKVQGLDKTGAVKVTKTVKVYIQNKAKKVKAAKKIVTVKNKKTVNVTLKVTAVNKKQATTDTVKVTGKNVKLTKSSAKKGKVVVTLKGTKKGTKKVTAKVGAKKATFKVKVK